MILRGEGNVDKLFRDDEFAFTYMIVDCLDLMGEPGEIVETEHRTGPLERMEGAEDPADGL